MFLAEYQRNDIENCLVLYPLYSVRLSGFIIINPLSHDRRGIWMLSLQSASTALALFIILPISSIVHSFMLSIHCFSVLLLLLFPSTIPSMIILAKLLSCLMCPTIGAFFSLQFPLTLLMCQLLHLFGLQCFHLWRAQYMGSVTYACNT